MALSIRVAASNADLTAIGSLFQAKVPVTKSGVVTYGAKTMTDTTGAFLSLPGTIVGMTITVGAKTGTIASRTATVVTLVSNWTGGAPAAGSAYSITPGFSIRDELIQDWGGVIPFTLAFWQAILADVDSRVVMGFQPASTLRGATYWHREGGVWWLKLTGVDKTITAALRTDGFRDFVLEAAGSVPAQTRFGGVTKPGGKLDTFLQPKLSGRTLLDGNVIYIATAAEMLTI